MGIGLLFANKALFDIIVAEISLLFSYAAFILQLKNELDRAIAFSKLPRPRNCLKSITLCI